MALIKCPECGKEVSDTAAACPNCGYAVAEFVAEENRKLQQKKKEEEEKRLAAEREAKRAKEAAEREEREAARKKEFEEKKPLYKKIALAAAGAAVVCIVIVILVVNVVIPSNKYKNAVSLKENGDYEAAITVFEELDGYRDSTDQIDACKTAIKEKLYNEAIDAAKSCHYAEAYRNFGTLDGYKDSIEQQNSIRSDMISNAKVGDVIYFGKYEQDDDESNGEEEIEWIVLDKRSSKVLVISKYVLDYDYYSMAITDKSIWSLSGLRSDLNSTFFNNAFTEDEQSCIVRTKIEPDEAAKYTDTTEDHVFILSGDEAWNYTDYLEAGPTEYAMSWGIETDEILGENRCEWWLRNTNDSWTRAGLVDCYGGINDFTLWVFSDSKAVDEKCGVRPAMWISFDS